MLLGPRGRGGVGGVDSGGLKGGATWEEASRRMEGGLAG